MNQNEPQDIEVNKLLPVYIVDDDESVRESLAFMLKEHGFIVSVFSDGNEFLAKVDLSESGCVILDSRMPNLRGQQVHQILNESYSPLSVIFLTGHGDVPMAVEALKVGAVNFFQKPVKSTELIPAIEQAFSLSVAKIVNSSARVILDSLTAREVDILRQIIKGNRNQRIADELFIAVRTVEVHRANLLKKFSAKTVAELSYIYGKLQSE